MQKWGYAKEESPSSIFFGNTNIIWGNKKRHLYDKFAILISINENRIGSIKVIALKKWYKQEKWKLWNNDKSLKKIRRKNKRKKIEEPDIEVVETLYNGSHESSKEKK